MVHILLFGLYDLWRGWLNLNKHYYNFSRKLVCVFISCAQGKQSYGFFTHLLTGL